MKKIITLILIMAAFAMAHDVKVDLQNALKKLKNCYLSTGEEAIELALSDDGREFHKMYTGAVYYSCDNGYFTYIQDRIKGDFIRGEICKKSKSDSPMFGICPDSKSTIWFQFQVYSHNNKWDGWFNETDANDIRIKSIETESTKIYGEKLMMDVYHIFASKR